MLALQTMDSSSAVPQDWGSVTQFHLVFPSLTLVETTQENNEPEQELMWTQGMAQSLPDIAIFHLYEGIIYIYIYFKN